MAFCGALAVAMLAALLDPLAARASTPRHDVLTTEQIMVGGTLRTYDLFVPQSYDAVGAVHALALVFHGLWSNQISLEQFVTPAASAYGVVVAFPLGIGESWNAGECCGSAKEAGVDDIGFATQLAAQLTARFRPRRVVAAGYSNGAMLSWRLACQPHSFVAGIVDASGTEALNAPACTPTRRVMATAVHGRQDHTVPFDGGASTTTQVETASPPFRAITSVITEWGRDHHRCSWYSANHLPGWSQIHWAGCPDGSTVTLYAIDGMGHDVPNYAAGMPVDFGSLIVDTAARAR
ncbi:MAG: CE1 family esterase [Acidimicrobiales bacterium]